VVVISLRRLPGARRGARLPPGDHRRQAPRLPGTALRRARGHAGPL